MCPQAGWEELSHEKESRMELHAARPFLSKSHDYPLCPQGEVLAPRQERIVAYGRWGQIRATLPAGSVTLGKLLSLSQPQFPCLQIPASKNC